MSEPRPYPTEEAIDAVMTKVLAALTDDELEDLCAHLDGTPDAAEESILWRLERALQKRRPHLFVDPDEYDGVKFEEGK